MTIYGADTSHWKWTAGIDFVKAKASGKCDFLFAKATEGVGYVDPSYSGWRGAKAIGVLFGSFHFARPGSPVEQADYYLAAAKPVAQGAPSIRCWMKDFWSGSWMCMNSTPIEPQ